MDGKYAVDIVRALRAELNSIYYEEGSTDKAVYISQELDKYILLAQINLLNKTK